TGGTIRCQLLISVTTSRSSLTITNGGRLLQTDRKLRSASDPSTFCNLTECSRRVSISAWSDERSSSRNRDETRSRFLIFPAGRSRLASIRLMPTDTGTKKRSPFFCHLTRLTSLMRSQGKGSERKASKVIPPRRANVPKKDRWLNSSNCRSQLCHKCQLNRVA